MPDGSTLDQLFLKRSGPTTRALLVTEDLAGARFRTELTLPTRDLAEAARLLARHLVRRGEVVAVERVRVRVERAATHEDAPELKEILIAAYRSLAAEQG